jgi:hypothetical protein
MSEGLTVVPEALYTLRIHKAEYVAVPKSKDAKGPYIKCQIIITGGGPVDEQGQPLPNAAQYVGRYVFQNYSMSGDGSFRLRELLQVTGHPDDFRLTDDQALVGLEFKGAVVIQPGTQGYSDKNQISKHFPLI